MSAPTDHEAPLRWLAAKLHDGAPLAERVRALRKKRRKAKAPVELPLFNDRAETGVIRL